MEQMERHPLLFPDFKPYELPYTPNYGLCARKDAPYTDDFGCVWETTDDGITGTVVGHPLEGLGRLFKLCFSGSHEADGHWSGRLGTDQGQHPEAQGQRRIDGGRLRHGHTFLQLSDLRGYTNLLFDMADEEPLLWDLIERLEAFNHAIIRKYLEIGVDMVSFPEDLGMQVGPMLSPEYFKKYIKPSYSRMMNSAREKGVPVHMHSDGDIRTLADDLIESRVRSSTFRIWSMASTGFGIGSGERFAWIWISIAKA